MAPEGWTEERLGNLFESRRDKGAPGLPTVSVTMNDGLVHRDTLDRKTDTNLEAEGHLLINKGDIAYNMMRMWQGASGLADYDAIVSPAYIVLKPTARINSQFAAYLFKSPRFIYLFWAYSYGLTSDRLRLYFKDFSLIPVALPPLPEQQKIAEILATWDRAIETVEKLIANSQAQKKALMQQLLSSKVRFPKFQDQVWDNGKLQECCLVKAAYGANAPAIPLSSSQPRYLRITDVSDTGSVLSTDAKSVDRAKAKGCFLEHGDIVFARSGATVGKAYLHKSSDEIAYAGYLIRFRPNPKVLNADFLFNFVRSDRYWEWVRTSIRAGAQPNINAKEYGSLPVPLPRIPEQKRIADALDTMDQEVTGLQKMRRNLKTERAALMQQILSGKRRVRVLEDAA
ncbi:MAG: restriction endonuclease subunit S [Pseudomonadota bacterium]